MWEEERAEYLAVFLSATTLKALPTSVELVDQYDMAKVSTNVASHAKQRPNSKLHNCISQFILIELFVFLWNKFNILFSQAVNILIFLRKQKQINLKMWSCLKLPN